MNPHSSLGFCMIKCVGMTFAIFVPKNPNPSVWKCGGLWHRSGVAISPGGPGRRHRQILGHSWELMLKDLFKPSPDPAASGCVTMDLAGRGVCDSPSLALPPALLNGCKTSNQTEQRLSVYDGWSRRPGRRCALQSDV